ncbi:MAG: hypothetical protein CMP10_07385 [Zetaproteobacteria bacterium]|nr:hypothetical protein [Pseudobdellovibrionaceae bacterium]
MLFKNKMSGATLIESILGVGILILIVVSTTRFVGNNLKGTQKERYRSARNQLIYMISESLNNPENIALSAVKGGVFNADLTNCIQNISGSGGVCRAVGIRNAKSFNLHAVGDTETGTILTRTPNRGQSLFYDWNLHSTSDPNKGKLNPIVYFWAECGINPTNGRINDSCNKAANIYLAFVIQPVSGPYSPNFVGSAAGPDVFYPYPDGVITKNGRIRVSDLYKNASVIAANEITGRMASTCPLGKYLKGYDSNGRIICKCFTDECTAKKCRSDQVIVDYLSNGQPVCRSLTNASNFTCFTRRAQQRGSRPAIYCPANHWLTSVHGDQCRGGARFSRSGKGTWVANANWEITCDKKQEYTCCQFKG